MSEHKQGYELVPPPPSPQPTKPTPPLEYVRIIAYVLVFPPSLGMTGYEGDVFVSPPPVSEKCSIFF